MVCDTIIDSNILDDAYWNMTDIFPNNHGGVSQSFVTPASPAYELCKARFKIRKYGLPTGEMAARLYAHAGVFGASSVPTGDPLAESAALDIEDLTTTPTFTDFIFSGVNKYPMSVSTHYCIVFILKSGTFDAANFVRARYYTSDVSAGNFAVRFNGWLVYADYDLAFYVYGEEVAKAVKIQMDGLVSICHAL